jgi:hypothetical protein
VPAVAGLFHELKEDQNRAQITIGGTKVLYYYAPLAGEPPCHKERRIVRQLEPIAVYQSEYRAAGATQRHLLLNRRIVRQQESPLFFIPSPGSG